MLIRYDPFREFDRLTEQLASTATRVPRAFPMDAYRRGDQFIVEFDLPGVEPASIDLTVENNVLACGPSGAVSLERATRCSWPSARTGPTLASSSSPTRSTPRTCRPAMSTAC
jgi:hypothetical protein